MAKNELLKTTMVCVHGGFSRIHERLLQRETQITQLRTNTKAYKRPLSPFYSKYNSQSMHISPQLNVYTYVETGMYEKRMMRLGSSLESC